MSAGYAIQFVSPPTFEEWNYSNQDTVGIGGSETALTEMATRLAARGHSVTVYAPIPADTPTPHKGVEWRHLDSMTEADWAKPGHWLLSRCPEYADNFSLTHPGQKLWLICQDEDYPYRWEERVDRRLKFNRIVALCEAQRDQFRRRYPSSASAVCQSSNGLRRELVEEVLAENLPRDPLRLIYTSSPDRGLDLALGIHQRLREYVPDATLHVCYGFDNIDKALSQWEQIKAEGKVNELTARTNRRWENILKLKERLRTLPGVVHHGRMPQRELYRQIAQASYWVYATGFRETSPVHPDTQISTVGEFYCNKPWPTIRELSGTHSHIVQSLNAQGELAASIANEVRCYRPMTEMVEIIGIDVVGKVYKLILTPDHEVMLAEPNEWFKGKQEAKLLRMIESQPGGEIELFPPTKVSHFAPVIRLGQHDVRTYCPAGELHPGDRVRVVNPDGKSGVATICDVRAAPPADGYCMNVTPDHNFVANGIVVHNCITSMEMQALGAIPIVSPLWAVGENVQHGVHIPGDPVNDWLTQCRFVGELVRLIIDPERQEEIRAAMMPWAAKKFDYERFCDQWVGWMAEDMK